MSVNIPSNEKHIPIEGENTSDKEKPKTRAEKVASVVINNFEDNSSNRPTESIKTREVSIKDSKLENNNQVQTLFRSNVSKKSHTLDSPSDLKSDTQPSENKIDEFCSREIKPYLKSNNKIPKDYYNKLKQELKEQVTEELKKMLEKGPIKNPFSLNLKSKSILIYQNKEGDLINMREAPIIKSFFGETQFDDNMALELLKKIDNLQSHPYTREVAVGNTTRILVKNEGRIKISRPEDFNIPWTNWEYKFEPSEITVPKMANKLKAGDAPILTKEVSKSEQSPITVLNTANKLKAGDAPILTKEVSQSEQSAITVLKMANKLNPGDAQILTKEVLEKEGLNLPDTIGVLVYKDPYGNAAFQTLKKEDIQALQQLQKGELFINQEKIESFDLLINKKQGGNPTDTGFIITAKEGELHIETKKTT